MNMVWHVLEFIQFSMREMFRNCEHALFCKLTSGIQKHYSISNVSKDYFSVESTNGYEIGASARVIVAFQPGGSAVWDLVVWCQWDLL